MPNWDAFRQDMRYALRNLRREPGFFLIAVAIIGLGIGAATAVFSVADAALLRPLPFHEPERLAWLANTGGDSGLSSLTSRVANLRDYRRMSQSFDDLAGYFAFFDYSRNNLLVDGKAESLVGVGVTQNFLELLGVQPALGRGFDDEESKWNGRPAVLLAHAFWERRFGGDPAVVGSTIDLNNQSTTIVGVLPRTFDFASIFSPGAPIDLLTPFPIADETDRWGNTLAIIGRLHPGAEIGGAQAELDLINQQLQLEFPRRWGLGAALTPLREQISGPNRQALLVLVAAVGLLLLIACANLSNLLLARASARRKEIAVRSALGASRFRLVRQMLTESLVLSCAGGLVGVLIAVVGVRAAAGSSAVNIPLLRTAQVDASALGFTLLAALATGLLFGLAPALQVGRAREHTALKESARGSSEGAGRAWLRNALVVSEVALACVLLVGAGLLFRSFLTLMDVDLGFQSARAAAWRIETGGRYPNLADRRAFFDRLTRSVAEVPGVESVGLTDSLPLSRNRTWGVRAKGEVYEEGESPFAYPRVVDHGYTSSMRIPLISGRGFAPSDTSANENVVLVNERMAANVFSGGDAVGRILLNGRDEWRVVGVVGNVRHSALEQEAGNEMYFPYLQMADFSSMDLVVRSSAPLSATAPGVRAALLAADSASPADDVQPLGALVDRAVSPRRFTLTLLGAFAAAALALASLGIYGVVSYSVSRRTQEIGIRMALGASASKIRFGVLTKALSLAAIGLLIGLAGSLALARIITSLLFAVAPTDPMTFGEMTLTLLTIALLAGYLPAMRASHVSPTVALRAE